MKELVLGSCRCYPEGTVIMCTKFHGFWRNNKRKRPSTAATGDLLLNIAGTNLKPTCADRDVLAETLLAMLARPLTEERSPRAFTHKLACCDSSGESENASIISDAVSMPTQIGQKAYVKNVLHRSSTSSSAWISKAWNYRRRYSSSYSFVPLHRSNLTAHLVMSKKTNSCKVPTYNNKNIQPNWKPPPFLSSRLKTNTDRSVKKEKRSVTL